MPTKLKTPIVITLDTVEDAISLCHRLNLTKKRTVEGGYSTAHLGENYAQWRYLKDALEERGIDYLTWQPPTPLRAGSYDVEILADGSIKCNCQIITNDQFEAIAKARGEVVKGKEGEWPKFWNHDGRVIFKADSLEDSGVCYDFPFKDKPRSPHSSMSMVNHCKCFNIPEITRAEASKILGREV